MSTKQLKEQLLYLKRYNSMQKNREFLQQLRKEQEENRLKNINLRKQNDKTI